MIRERAFYKTFFSMAAVLILQNVLTFSVNLADNIMLGGYSEAALSGAAAVNQIQFVYQSLMTATAEGVVILGSQYFGKKQTEPIKTVSAHALRLGLLICVLLFAAVTLFPRPLVSLFTESDAIVEQGLRYLHAVRWTYPFFAVTQVLLGVLRSVGVVHIAPVLSGSTLVINCAINYTLIYGRFGAPELGVTGAAIGTITARVAELLILILFLWKGEKRLALRPRDFLRRDKTLFRDYLGVALPILLVNGLWGLNTAAQNAIMGHVSDHAFAANSVASPLFTLVKSGAIGAASAAGFVIGKAVGEGDEKKLRAAARTLQVLFLAIGVVSGAILWVVRAPILSLYDLSPETFTLADRFLKILALIIVGMAYQMPTNMGIIRGGGNTRFPMILDLVSIWAIVLPLSALLAFVFHASPAWVVFCLNADQLFKGVPVFLKANFGSWARSLTRDPVPAAGLPENG